MSTGLKSKPKAKHKQNLKRKKQLQTQAEPKGRVLDLLEGKQLTPEEETKALRQRANERTLVNWYAVGWLTLIHLGVLAAPFDPVKAVIGHRLMSEEQEALGKLSRADFATMTSLASALHLDRHALDDIANNPRCRLRHL